MPSASSSSTNQSLIERVLHRDPIAWSQFVELYGPLIQYWCRRSGLSTEFAEDCVQEVFVVILRQLGRYRPLHGDSFRGWLWQVTRNKVIDMIRRASRQTQSVGGSSAQIVLRNLVAPPEDEQTEPIELEMLMYRSIEQVRAEFEARTWQAFERTVIDGLTTDAAGQELDLPSATIRQYRSRILRRIRQQLGELK